MPAISTFGRTSLQLRADVDDAAAARGVRSPPRTAVPLPGALRPRGPATPADLLRVTLPNELWRQIASHLEVNDALRLRQCSAYCFDIVADTHREAFATQLPRAVVSPEPHRPRPPLAAVLPLMGDVRQLSCPIGPMYYDIYSSDARDDALHDSLGELLRHATGAISVALPLGAPVRRRFVDRPLLLPPAVDTLRLEQLCCPARPGDDMALDLPAFFAANAARDVATLVLARSASRSLGDRRAWDQPLFPWALRCLELYDVPLDTCDFGRLLRSNLDALDTLVLAEAPDARPHFEPLGTSLEPGQLKDLCAAPFPKLRRLELFGDFDRQEVRAFARRAWPCLEVLRLRGERLDNDDAEALAQLRAPKLRKLTFEGPANLYALASLLHPAHAPLRELAIFFTQSPRGWRQNHVAPPSDVAGASRPSPVRYLRLGQSVPLLPGDAERLARALSPAAPVLRELEVHTCRGELGGAVSRALPNVLAEVGLVEQAGGAVVLSDCERPDRAG